MRYQAARKLFANNGYLRRIYKVDNEDCQPVDGEEHTGNTEQVVEHVEQGEVEAVLVAVLAEVKEGDLGQDQQEAARPPSHKGQERRLPAPVDMVLSRRLGIFFLRGESVNRSKKQLDRKKMTESALSLLSLELP